MDLDELRAFITVVETGSIQSAARSLRFARATLRRRLDELAARAGVPLLRRTDGGLVPTEAGQVLAQRGRLILQEAGALLSSVREVGREPSGTLRVLTPVGLPPMMMAPLLTTMRRNFAKLGFRIDLADDPLSRLLDDIDVAVHYGDATLTGPWLSYDLMRGRTCLVASASYLRVHGRPRDLADLAGRELYRWVMPGEDGRSLPLVDGTTLAIAPTIASTDVHLLRRCAAVGDALAFVPDSHDGPVGPIDDLEPVLPDLVGGTWRMRMTVPAALAEIPRIWAVVEEIRRFASVPPPRPSAP